MRYFKFYGREFSIDENGLITKLAYEDDRPHKYGDTIKVLHRHNKAKVIRPFEDKYGYMQVILQANKHKKHWSVHQLVYAVYVLGINDVSNKDLGYDFKNNFYQINHIDGNKKNNNYKNLELISLQENIKHAVDNKLHNSQISAKYVEIYRYGKYLNTIWKTREASNWIKETYGIYINCGTISRLVRSGNMTCDGFSFKYKV